MRLRFKSTLVCIFILFIFCIFVGVGYMFYKDVRNEADIVVDGDITINYLNGRVFNLNGDAKIEFSVTNNNTDPKYFYIQLTDVYAKNVSYELTSSNDLDITNDLKSDIISNQISINGNETVNYTFKFKSEEKENYSGIIQVGLKSNEENNFADVILKNNKIASASLTSIGDEAILDEGLLSTQDDLGISYYFRGNVSNNNVNFAGLNWKIVKVNGDGSVKLVLSDILETIGKYYNESYDFLGSNAYDLLDAWFSNNLRDYSDYIAYYKYCNDLVLETDGTFAAFNRIITNKIPNNVCLGTPTNAKIGLLTADEVMLAGAGEEENTSYYLYNENIKTAYFTMTSAKVEESGYQPFVVSTNGALLSDTSGTLLRGIRPVINIIKNARVNGSGTVEDPYTIITN